MSAPARPARRVVPATPKLQERARAERVERRRRRVRSAGRRTANALVVLLPLLALAWVALASTWLAVDRVEVTGNARLPVDEVVEAAAVAAGTPLARVDTGEVEDRVAALAPVAEVAVRRTWPGTLTVEVVERTPVAFSPALGTTAVLVDASGVPFGTEPTAPPGLVRLEVEDVGPDDPATLAALEVHAALPDSLRTQVAAVQAPSPSAVTLLLQDGRSVVWGRPGGTGTKAPAVLALLRGAGTVFDVSAGDVVVVK